MSNDKTPLDLSTFVRRHGTRVGPGFKWFVDDVKGMSLGDIKALRALLSQDKGKAP